MSKNGREDLPKRIEVIHRDSVDNLMRAKRQQWQATYYAVLVYGAIFGLSQTLKPVATVSEKHWLTIAVLVTWAYTSYLVLKIQDGLGKPRRRLGWIYSQPYYTDEERAALELDKNIGKRSFWRDPEFLIGTLAILFGAGALVCLLLWREVAPPPPPLSRAWWPAWW
jgi:hypothetical protein